MKTIIKRLLINQIMKSVCLLMVGVFAVLTVSCNDNLEVGIKKDNPQPTVTTYDMAKGIYFGDKIASGSAFFRLDLSHSSNPNNSTVIMGFCTLPSSFADFRLDEGTYNIATTGVGRSLYPGMMEDDVKIGTFLYDTETEKITWIRSGSITITQSGNSYTINGNFIGKDTATGNTEENIRFSYTGTIDFTELPLSFEDIGNSTYIATGTPRWLDTPGLNTWTGTLEVVNDGNERKYKIINWGNQGNDYYVYCIYRDGKIYLDYTTKIASNNTYDGYVRIGIIREANTLSLYRSDEYEISYNKTTRILDFGGSINSSGQSYPALMGIAAFNKNTGDAGSVFSDFYENLKLQLTPNQTSLRSTTTLTSGQIASVLKDMNFTRQSAKPATNSTPTVIVLDKLHNTTAKTILSQKKSEE